MLVEPPICDRCRDSPESIAKLEQHACILRMIAQTSQKDSDTGACEASHPIAQMTNPRAMVNTLFEEKQTLRHQDLVRTAQPSRPLPAWMSLLPSNVNSHVRPPNHSVLPRRMSFPAYSSSSNSTPNMNPLEWPVSQDDYPLKHLRTSPQLSLDGEITPPHSSQKQKRNSSRNPTSMLGQTQEHLSPTNSVFPTASPAQAHEDVHSAQGPATNCPTARDTTAITIYPFFKSTYSALPHTNRRASSSEAHLTSYDRAEGSDEPFTPHTLPYRLNPDASSPEGRTANIYAASPSSSTKFSNQLTTGEVLFNNEHAQHKTSQHNPPPPTLQRRHSRLRLGV